MPKSTGKSDEPSLFGDELPSQRPHDCARDGHVWTKGTHVWPGETIERLVWKCLYCPEMRGRA